MVKIVRGDVDVVEDDLCDWEEGDEEAYPTPNAFFNLAEWLDDYNWWVNCLMTSLFYLTS